MEKFKREREAKSKGKEGKASKAILSPTPVFKEPVIALFFVCFLFVVVVVCVCVCMYVCV